jgi:hypothetical protein
MPDDGGAAAAGEGSISRADRRLAFAHALLKVGWALQFGLTNAARTGKLLDLCAHDMKTLNFCNTVLWTGANLSIALVSPLIGALSDAFGRIPILLMGRLGLIGWLVGTSASTKLWQYMLADMLPWGWISASTQAVEDAWFADVFGERPQLSGRLRAQNGVWGGIAGFASPFVGIWLARRKPEIHRVDPEFGSTLKAIIGIFSQTAGSTCEFWVNPVNFTLEPHRHVLHRHHHAAVPVRRLRLARRDPAAVRAEAAHVEPRQPLRVLPPALQQRPWAAAPRGVRRLLHRLHHGLGHPGSLPVRAHWHVCPRPPGAVKRH